MEQLQKKSSIYTKIPNFDKFWGKKPTTLHSNGEIWLVEANPVKANLGFALSCKISSE